MQENGFWDDVKRAEEVTKECKIIKDKIERYENLVSRIDDVEVLAELAQEDEDTVNEVIQEIRSIEKEVESYRVELLLSGEYDRNNAIIELHPGAGGTDMQVLEGQMLMIGLKCFLECIQDGVIRRDIKLKL